MFDFFLKSFQKKTLILFFLLNLTFFLPSIAHSSIPHDNNNVTFAVINMQKISESSVAFQDIKKQMEEKANSMRVKFDNKAKDIRKNEADLEKKSKVLKPEALKEEIENLKKESQKMNEELNSDRQKLERVYFETMNDFQTKVKKIISEYSEKNNVDGVFESSTMIFFGKNVKDITDILSAKINQEIKNYKIKFD
jgi:Skp family chaperone for outer membrane proteins